MNWRKILIEAALKADEERAIKHIVQIARGIITREEFVFQMALTVMNKMDVRDASEKLQEAVANAVRDQLTVVLLYRL